MQGTRGFLKLGLGIAVIWIMMFWCIPAFINTVPGYKTYADEAERRGITTSALFYTNVEQAREAEQYLLNTWRFGPRPMEER